jgi:hypothetical protein
MNVYYITNIVVVGNLNTIVNMEAFSFHESWITVKRKYYTQKDNSINSTFHLQNNVCGKTIIIVMNERSNTNLK